MVRNSTFRLLGASNHADHERQKDDFYATEPLATKLLVRIEDFEGDILEPACGQGHISKVLENYGYNVVSRDIVNRGYGEVADFLSKRNTFFDGNIITNPPYKYAQEFVEKALSIIPYGKKVAMFLKLQFMESKSRRDLFKNNPPIRVWVSSARLKCAINADFAAVGSSAAAYAWFVWVKGFKGNTTLKWFN